MFTDIAGYSSMVSRDEKGAMKLLSMHDKIIEPILNDHGGKIIKKIGDSIFARFNIPRKKWHLYKRGAQNISCA